MIDSWQILPTTLRNEVSECVVYDVAGNICQARP